MGLTRITMAGVALVQGYFGLAISFAPSPPSGELVGLRLLGMAYLGAVIVGLVCALDPGRRTVAATLASNLVFALLAVSVLWHGMGRLDLGMIRYVCAPSLCAILLALWMRACPRREVLI